MVAVLLSTTVDRVLSIKSFQFPVKDDLKYYIVCQGDTNYEKENEIKEKIKYLFPISLIIFMKEMGLSRSRNKCMEIALQENLAEFMYIADDDITIIYEGLKKLCKNAVDFNLDIVTGKIKTTNGNNYKKYKNYQKNINIISCAKISSVEIVLNCNFFVKNEIRFDEKFGLGSVYKCGEEYIFLTDAYKKKAKIEFFPEVICIHPSESTGKKLLNTAKARGAVFIRVYGIIGFIFIFFFVLKKKNISILLKMLAGGINYINRK